MKFLVTIYGLACLSLIEGNFLSESNWEKSAAPRIVNHYPQINDFNRNPVLQYLGPIYDFPVLYYYPRHDPRPDGVVLINRKYNAPTFDPRAETSQPRPFPRVVRRAREVLDLKRIGRSGGGTSGNLTENVIRIHAYKNNAPGSKSAKTAGKSVPLESLESTTESSKTPQISQVIATYVDQPKTQTGSEPDQSESLKSSESFAPSPKFDQIAVENQRSFLSIEKLSEISYPNPLESLESETSFTNFPHSDPNLSENHYPYFNHHEDCVSTHLKPLESPESLNPYPFDDNAYDKFYSYGNHQENSKSAYPKVLESPDSSTISPQLSQIDQLITTLTGESPVTIPPYLEHVLTYTTSSYDHRNVDPLPMNHQIQAQHDLPTWQEIELVERAMAKIRAESPENLQIEPSIHPDHMLPKSQFSCDSPSQVPLASYLPYFPYLNWQNPTPTPYSDHQFISPSY